MTPFRLSRPNFILSSTIAIALAAFAGSVAKAQTITWDPTGSQSNSGGTGTWNTSLFQWNIGGADLTWPNTNAATAVFAGSAGTVTLDNGGTLMSVGSLQFTTAGYTLAGQTANDGLDFGSALGSIDTHTLTTANQTNISANLSGTGGLTIAANGDLSATGNGAGGFFELSGTNTNLTGGITVTSGLLNFNAPAALGSTSTTAGSGNTITLNNGGLVDTITGSTVIGNDITLVNTGTLRVYGNRTLTLNGTISGTGALSKTDTGTLVLANSGNTFTGGVNINSSVIQVGAAEVAGVSGPLGAGGTISFGGGTLQYSSVNQYDYSSRFSSAASQAINVDTNGQAVTWASPLTSSGGTLTLNDTNATKGSLTLTAANSYTGGTTVSGGTLMISGSGTLGATTATLTVNTAGIVDLGTTTQSVGAFTINGGTVQNGTIAASSYTLKGGTISANIGNAAPITATSGSTTLSGAANQLTSATITGGYLTFANSGSLGTTSSGGITISTTGSLVASGAQTTVMGWLNSGLVNSSSTGNIAITGNSSENINFAGYNTLGLSSTGTATYSGTITPGTGGYIFGGDSSSLTISSTLSGSNGLTKNGAGTVILTGANTFTGPITVNKGILEASVPVAAGTETAFGTGAITVNSGATLLFLTGSTSNIQTWNNAITLNGGTLQSQDGNANYAGAITLGSGTNTIDVYWNNKPATFTGVISGSGALTFGTTSGAGGTGVAILAAANTFTGGTTLPSATKLSLQNANALRFSTLTDNGGTLTFDKSITGNAFTIGGLAGTGNIALQNNATAPAAVSLTSGGNNTSNTYSGILSGAGSVNLAGLGTQTLTGANTYTGGTTVTGGGLKLDFTGTGAPGTNILSSSGALTLNGATLTLNGKANTGNSQTVSGMTFGLGASTISITTNATSNPLLFTLNGLTRNVGATVNFTQPTNGAVGAANGYATSTTDTNGIIGGWATVGGTDWANNNGTNIVALASYTTTTSAGTTTSSYTNGNIDVTSSVAPSGAITANTLRFNTAAAETLTLSGTNTIQSGGILETAAVGNNASKITGGTLAGPAGQDLVIIQNNTSNTLTISSNIIDNGTGAGLTKSGAGALTLSGSIANTFTGTTYVNAGTLTLSMTSGVSALGGNVVVNGGTLSWGSNAANQLSSTASITVQGGTGGTSVSSGISSVITDTVQSVNVIGNMTRFNPGSGSNMTITGNFLLQGTAGAGNPNYYSLAANSKNSTLSVGSISMDGSTSGAATYQIGQAGGGFNATLNLAGNFTATGTSGLIVGATGGAGLNRLALTSGGQQIFDIQGTTTISAAITGTGGIDKTNTGTLIINQGAGAGTSTQSDFSGGLTVDAGTVNLMTAISGAGGVTVNSGALVVSGSISGTSSVAVNGGTFQLSSSGSVSSAATTVSAGTFQANGTVTSPTTVNGGILSGGGTINGLVTVNSGGTLAPGQNGLGKFTLNNGLTLNTGGHLALTLGGTSLTSQYAPIVMSGGDITLGGDLQLTLGYTPASGDTFYVIIDQGGGALNGVFSNAVDQGNGTGLITAGGNQFLVSYSANLSSGSFTGGEDVALKVIAVPEPGALVSLLGGAGILLGLRRRRTA